MTKTQLPRTGVSQWSADADTWPGRVGWNTELSVINGAMAIWGQGLNSARPVSAYSGRYYWATDTQRLWYDTGTTWIEASPIGGGGSPVGNTIGNAAAEGTSRIGARADHVHALPVPSTDPAAIAYGGSMNRGASSTVARSDHTHALPALPYASAAPGVVSDQAAGIVGVSTDLARKDHTHTLQTTEFGGIWQSAGTDSLASNTTGGSIPMTSLVANTGINAGSALSSGRVVIPYTGIYGGFARVIFPPNTVGNRGVGYNPGNGLSGMHFNAITNGSVLNAFTIPIQDRFTAGQAVTVDCWQTSGGNATVTAVLALHLVALG